MSSRESADDPFPDETVPREIEAAERALDTGPRRFLTWAVVVATVASGWTLLLPWEYGRRYGLETSRLGIELYVAPAVSCAVGLVAALAALVYRPRLATVISVLAGAVFVVTVARADAGSAPGRAFAMAAGVLWLAAGAIRLLTEVRRTPAADADPADGIDRLRGNRDRFRSG